MAGIDRATGKLLSGWPHVVQSIYVLFTTGYGLRIMREYFGSDVPRLLGANITPRTALLYQSSVKIALDLWEPRFRVNSVEARQSANTPENVRAGKFSLTMRGIYYPRALEGDFTPAPGETTLTIVSGNQGIELI